MHTATATNPDGTLTTTATGSTPEEAKFNAQWAYTEEHGEPPARVEQEIDTARTIL